MSEGVYRIPYRRSPGRRRLPMLDVPPVVGHTVRPAGLDVFVTGLAAGLDVFVTGLSAGLDVFVTGLGAGLDDVN